MFRTYQTAFGLVFALLACSIAGAGGKPDVWLEVRSPHFTVVSNGNEREARRVADQFERIRAMFHLVFPHLRVDPSAPIVVLAAKNKRTFDSLLPKSMLAKGAAQRTGLFQKGPEKNYVLLQLDAPGENPYQVLYHEYTHLLLHQIPVALPPWLDEGLAEFYGNTVIDKKEVLFGQLDRYDVELLRQSRLLPLPALFEVTHSSPYYNEDNKANIFYAESWALVHMLMEESFKQQRHPLTDYINDLQLKMDPVAAASRAFGPLPELEKRLKMYIAGSGFKYFYAKAQTQADDQAFTVRELPPAEADAVRGDCMVYNGNFEGARAALAAALQDDPQNPQAAESLGFLELQQQHWTEANKWFTQAIHLNSKSYLAQYYYAIMRMQESHQAGLGDGVGESLRKAIAINPDFAPAYNALAQFYSNRNENLEEAHLMALRAVTLEPADVYYYLTTASVLLRMKQADNAVRVCKKALELAKEPGEIASAENLLASAEKYQEYLEKMKEYNAQAAAANAGRVSTASGGAEGQSAGGEMEAPPVLRHRGEAPPRLQHREGTQAEEVSFHSDPAQRGVRDTLTGTIQEVKCSPPAVIRMTFVAGKQTLELFSGNFYDVAYSALNFTPSGVLNPCRDLKGYKAKVFFYDLKNKPNTGELISVQVRK